MRREIGYSVCPAENRGSLLLELMSRYWDGREMAWNKKVVILFAHDNSIKFYTELFQRLRELPVMPFLRADMVSQSGKENLSMFQESATGVMAVTSENGLKLLPKLSANTVIQFEPPPSDEFVHKVSSFCQLYHLFIRPQEVSFVKHMQDISGEDYLIEERVVPWKRIHKLPALKIQDYYREFHSMNINSKAAYKAYMDSIRDHAMPEHFNNEGIDIHEVADGYCLPVPPHYKLVKETSRYDAKMQEKQKEVPMPPTARRVADSFKIVKPKKRKVAVPKVIYTEGGLVKLYREADDKKKPRRNLAKRKAKDKFAQKVKAIKTLRKEFKKRGMGDVKLPSIRARRR